MSTCSCSSENFFEYKFNAAVYIVIVVTIQKIVLKNYTQWSLQQTSAVAAG